MIRSDVLFVDNFFALFSCWLNNIFFIQDLFCILANLTAQLAHFRNFVGPDPYQIRGPEAFYIVIDSVVVFF